MKRRATHNQYFPNFEDLISSVDEALAYFARHLEEIKNLMGCYIETLADLPVRCTQTGLPVAA